MWIWLYQFLGSYIYLENTSTDKKYWNLMQTATTERSASGSHKIYSFIQNGEQSNKLIQCRIFTPVYMIIASSFSLMQH